MKRRLLAILLAVAMLATSLFALPVFAANADLSMANGARTYYAFDQEHTGTVTIDFDLNIGSGSRFNMWLEAAGQAGYESAGNPWLQFTGEGALYLQDAIKVGNITHGQNNHLQVVVNLAAKSFTVSINNGTPVAATYTGDMANIAGFDYRMQNTAGTITNITVASAGAAPSPNPTPTLGSEDLGDTEVALNKDSQVDFSKGYTGTVTVKFDLTVSAGTGNVRIWLPIHGNDRTGTAKPMMSINQSGQVYAQQVTEVGRITLGSPASIVWVYDCAAGTYTVSVNGGEPSAAINCGAQDNVGAFAYKTIEEKTATIANLTVEGEVEGGSATEPDDVTEFYVGPDREYKTLNDVLSLLTDGDTVYVDGGYDYNERVTIKTPNVTIKGIGDEKPNFAPSVNGEIAGVFVLEADGIVLENVKITGDVYRDMNNPDWGNTSGHSGGNIYRGVFNAGNNIVIRNCDISHCVQGIQSNNDLAGSLTVEYCNIYENGSGWSDHNLYIATNNEKYPEATLTVQYNYIHDVNCDSNGLKSRALNNKVYYNWFENNSQEFELISMGSNEETLRQYESSNDVVGNVFVKTMDGRFCYQLGRFGGDGTGAGSYGRYRFANNTFAMLRNDFDWNYSALRLHMGIESVEVYNNIFYAPNVSAEWPMKVIDVIAPDWASGEPLVYGANNWVSEGSYLPGDTFVDEWTPDGVLLPGEFVNTIEGTNPGFVDVDNLDFHLLATSPLVGAGTTETVKTWPAWSNGGYSNKNTQIKNPLTAAYEPISKDAILDAANTAATPVARTEESVSIGAYGPVVVENYVGASIVGEETVEYPNDVVYNVVLSKVEGLNVLTLAAEYDPAVLTYKSIVPVYDELEEFSLEVDEDAGTIKAIYFIKNELITTEEAAEFVTLTFTSVEPGEEGVDATVALTHLTASGLPDAEQSVQYNTFIEVSEATTKIVLPVVETDINVICVGDIDYTVDGSVVTVDHEVACKIGYLDGEEYVAIAAVANGDGTYSFTAPEGVTEVLLVVKGDINGDGEISLADSTRAKAAYNKKTTPTAEAAFAADANGDGEITLADSTRIKAAYNKKTTLSW